MKSSKPPVLATWLLEHMRFCDAHDAVIGDLMEGFRQGRSPSWYWRQVFVAILIGFSSEVRHHSLLAIRSIAITVAANYLAIMLGAEFIAQLARHPQTHLGLYAMYLSFIMPFLGAATSGLILGLLHRKHRTAMLLTGAVTLFGLVVVRESLELRALEKYANVVSSPTFLQITIGTTFRCVVLWTGLVVGGSLFRPASKPLTPPNSPRPFA